MQTTREHAALLEGTEKNGDEPTVNKNGHLEKVSAGVCNLGSSSEMKGCEINTNRTHVRKPSYDDLSRRTFIRV